MRFKKWLKRLLKISLAFVALILAAWFFENWRGARAWKKAQERAHTAGLSLDLADFVKAPIPDNENLLKNPEFLHEWNGKTEPRLGRFSRMKIPGLARYFSSSTSPDTGKSVDYRKFFDEEASEEEALKRLQELTLPFKTRLDQLTEIILSYPVHDLGSYAVPTPETLSPELNIENILKLMGAFRDQAILSLRLGNPETALRYIECLDRLKNTFCKGAVINALVGWNLEQTIDGIIWEGIRLHAWNARQLQDLTAILQKTDHLQILDQTLRFELIYNLHSLDLIREIAEYHQTAWSGLWGVPVEVTLKDEFLLYLKTGGPSGWNLQRKAITVNMVLDFLEAPKKEQLTYTPPKTINADDVETNYSPFGLAEEFGEFFHSYRGLALKNTTLTRIALLGIALEQHFLKTGSYPASLDHLEYDFDITDAMHSQNRPLSYQLDPQGSPEIWSPHDSKIRWQLTQKKENTSKRNSKKSSIRE